MFFKNAAALARFSPAKMGKTTLASGETLFAGLNSFEPGQEHAMHAHAGQDKLYIVLQGEATVQVGDSVEQLRQGDAAFAPSGVPHGIRNVGTVNASYFAVTSPGDYQKVLVDRPA